MNLPVDLASRLLRFEQQLQAYQKLHADELAELWRSLNECKQAVAALCEESANGPVQALSAEPTQPNLEERKGEEYRDPDETSPR
ncbi:MAG TPA: hypothetical protein VFI11_06690 [Anaerolineales bacterium]|nr:hypothetical protein [Anaerolineales bacterium]